MTAPFSFPKLRREAVGAARFTTGAIKLCVLPRIAYNATAGVQQTSRQACRAVRGGFLTWAAKPRVRESPNPAKKSAATNTATKYGPEHFRPGHISIYYATLRLKVPLEFFQLAVTQVGREFDMSVSRT